LDDSNLGNSPIGLDVPTDSPVNSDVDISQESERMEIAAQEVHSGRRH